MFFTETICPNIKASYKMKYIWLRHLRPLHCGDIFISLMWHNDQIWRLGIMINNKFLSQGDQYYVDRESRSGLSGEERLGAENRLEYQICITISEIDDINHITCLVIICNITLYLFELVLQYHLFKLNWKL